MYQITLHYVYNFVVNGSQSYLIGLKSPFLLKISEILTTRGEKDIPHPYESLYSVKSSFTRDYIDEPPK